MKQGFVNIRGKEYKTVALRVNEFRQQFPDHSLLTEIVKLDDEQCLIKATVAKILMIDGEHRLVEVATGHAHEWRKSSQINGTSYVENCETSAIGRALSALGIGGSEFASAEEVANAIHQQITPPKNITPNAGALEQFDAEEQKFLLDLSKEITAAVADNSLSEAHDMTKGLDNEEKLALWSLLDSKTRSALKKYNESLKESA